MEGTWHENYQPHKPMREISEKRVLGIMWWEWMRAVLLSAISAWKQGLEMLFPRCWSVLGSALRGESLPKLGQAAQKQMRSDTGAKEDSPEPLRAHITKCSTLMLLCYVSTLNAEITDMERGRHVQMGWMSVFLFLCLQKKFVSREFSLRFKSICSGVSMSSLSTFTASPISI